MVATVDRGRRALPLGGHPTMHLYQHRQLQPALATFVDRLAPRFSRTEVHRHAEAYLVRLLATADGTARGRWVPVQPNTDGIGRMLNTAVWDTEQVHADIRDYVLQHLSSPDGALVIGEAGFVKKGNRSAGVERQLNPTSNRVENCQVGVFASYASDRGSALLDRRLHLPASWADDQTRRQRAGIPPEVGNPSGEELACEIVEGFRRSGSPLRWVVAEVATSDGPLADSCRNHRIGYVLRLGEPERCTVGGVPIGPIADLVRRIPRHAFEYRVYGDFPHLRHCDWAVVPRGRESNGFTSSVLIQRDCDDPAKVTAFACSAPIGTGMAELVRTAERRFATYECVAEARQRAGLGDYEVRKYLAWHRHMTLSTLLAATLRSGRRGAQPR